MVIKATLARRVLMYGLLSVSLVAMSACSDDDDDDDGVTPTPPTEMEGGMDGDDMDGDDDDDMDGDDDGDDDAVQETENDDGTSTFIVPLSGEQEVPMVDVDGATGEGNLIIDPASGQISGSIAVSGLSGQAQMAHIHQAFAGTNGGILITLVGSDEGATWTVPEGADGMLSAEGLTALGNGELYLNVHTAANMGGEIRGQIIPEDILLEDSELSGAEEVPPVTTEASGTGISTVNSETGAISATIVTSGVVAIAAHIHVGAEGVNGEVIIPLEQNADDANTWSTPAGAMLSAEQITAYEAEGLYFNVHSDANTDGEIRGQL